MTNEQTFEEQFPSLKGRDRPHPTFGLCKKIIEEYDVFYAGIIKEYCLDKQKVIDAIKSAFKTSGNDEDMMRILEKKLKLNLKIEDVQQTKKE